MKKFLSIIFCITLLIGANPVYGNLIITVGNALEVLDENEGDDCPNGGEKSKDGFCCKNGYIRDFPTDNYDEISPNLCGCPNGTQKVQSYRGYELKYPICCDGNGHQLVTEYHTEGWDGTKKTPEWHRNVSEFNIMCGCPDGGVRYDSSDDVTLVSFCCKNGFSFDKWKDSYSHFNPTACGCPDGGEKIKLLDGTYFGGSYGSICCKNGKAFSHNNEYYATDNGGYIVDSKYCCKPGEHWIPWSGDIWMQ